jgi:hypothetical protein
MIDEENIRNQVRNGVKILRIFQEEMGNIGNETEKLRNEKAILVKTLKDIRELTHFDVSFTFDMIDEALKKVGES